MKSKIKAFLKDERGDFGIKQIAYTVAIIVLIGVIITIVRAALPGWVDTIWNMFIDQIKKLMS